MYKALDHVTEEAAPSDPDDDWRAVDLHLSLWFMATLTDDLYRLVCGADGRACTTWARLHRFFLDNQASRYLFLNKAFRNTPCGDLPIATYASKLQAISDDLAAIGRPLDDRDLTLQFIDGLGGKFKLQAEILKSVVPLPSFAEACSRLQLAEVTADTEQKQAGSQVMVVHGGDRGQSSTGGGQQRPPGVSPNYKGKNPIPGYQGRGQGTSQHGGGGGSQQYNGGGQGRGRGQHDGGRGHGDTSGGCGGGQQPWLGYFAPWSMPFPPPRAPWIPPNSAGVLGPRPGVQSQAYPVMHSAPAMTVPNYQAPSWDHNAMNYGSAFPPHGDWVMDSGASSHVTGNPCNLTSSHSPLKHFSQQIVVGNGSRLPVVATGTTHLTSRPFYLNDVLVSPNIVKNLISTRKFSRDNSCSVKFDPFSFSVKDLATRRMLMRSNSSGDLYPFFGNNGTAPHTALTGSSDLWHRLLGHPSSHALSHLPLQFLSSCNNSPSTLSFCDACQLGKQARLPFSTSHSRATAPFDLIHCDLWTSPDRKSVV